jgi:RNA polymerase sigma factor (sigma-70 family)
LEGIEVATSLSESLAHRLLTADEEKQLLLELNKEKTSLLSVLASNLYCALEIKRNCELIADNDCTTEDEQQSTLTIYQRKELTYFSPIFEALEKIRKSTIEFLKDNKNWENRHILLNKLKSLLPQLFEDFPIHISVLEAVLKMFKNKFEIYSENEQLLINKLFTTKSDAIDLINNADKLYQKYLLIRDRLVQYNCRLVVDIAKKCLSSLPQRHVGLELIDLFQQGIVGLIIAIDRYDLNRLNEHGQSNKLSTYATNWIRQQIQQYINNQFHVHVPAHIKSMLHKMNKYMNMVGTETLNDKQKKELQRLLGCTKEELEHLLITRRKLMIVHINDKIGNKKSSNDDSEISLLLEDSSSGRVEERVDAGDQFKKVMDLVRDLDFKYKYILLFTTQSLFEYKLTLREIARIFRITNERVRQIAAKAQQKAKECLEQTPMTP